METNQKDCILIKDTQFINNSIGCVELINTQFNINLKLTSIEQIYKPHLTRRDGGFNWKTKLVCYLYKSQLTAITKKLESLSSETSM
jgi:hypothetical protein